MYRSGCLGLAEPCARDAGMSSFFGAPPRGAGSPTPGDNEVVEMDRAVNVVMKVMAEKEQLQKDYDALREEMPGHDITLPRRKTLVFAPQVRLLSLFPPPLCLPSTDAQSSCLHTSATRHPA